MICLFCSFLAGGSSKTAISDVVAVQLLTLLGLLLAACFSVDTPHMYNTAYRKVFFRRFVLKFLNDIYLLLLLLVVIVAFIPQLIVVSHVSLRRYDKKRSQQLTTNTMNMELISLTESL